MLICRSMVCSILSCISYIILIHAELSAENISFSSNSFWVRAWARQHILYVLFLICFFSPMQRPGHSCYRIRSCRTHRRNQTYNSVFDFYLYPSHVKYFLSLFLFIYSKSSFHRHDKNCFTSTFCKEFFAS